MVFFVLVFSNQINIHFFLKAGNEDSIIPNNEPDRLF